jgi:uncharacterized membrane protein (UPF0127 family)
MRFRIINSTRAAVLADRAERATSFAKRLKGLIGRSRLEPGEGLQISPCNSIHTFFMRFAVDVIFLDGAGRVLRAWPGIRPWRAIFCLGAKSVLELPAGTINRTGTCPADELNFELC